MQSLVFSSLAAIRRHVFTGNYSGDAEALAACEAYAVRSCRCRQPTTGQSLALAALNEMGTRGMGLPPLTAEEFKEWRAAKAVGETA